MVSSLFPFIILLVVEYCLYLRFPFALHLIPGAKLCCLLKPIDRTNTNNTTVIIIARVDQLYELFFEWVGMAPNQVAVRTIDWLP